MKNFTHTPHFDVRTDLAVEETERQQEIGHSLHDGIRIQTQEEADGQVNITRVTIENENGSTILGKPIGTYITLEAPSMDINDGECHRRISRSLAEQLQILINSCQDPRHHTQMPPLGSLDDALTGKASSSPLSVLVVGLGNGDVTPDALGPRVLSHTLITRHLHTGRFQMPAFSTEKASVCGIVPGVMAQTGMETAEIIKALIKQVQPDLVIVIDALAARSVTRLGTTIQLTDTGIHPGSGVGNHRHSLTKESLGIPVVAIGVPTVVGAAAIVTDTLDALIDVLCQETDTKHFADALRSMSPDEKYALVRELLEPRFGPMFVTPKDIDETVKRLSFLIAEGINLALFGEVPTPSE